MNVPMGSTRLFFSNCVRLSLAPWKGLQRCSRISSPPLTFVQFVRAQSEDQRITRLNFSNNTKRKFSRTFLNSIQTTLLYFSLLTLHICSWYSDDYSCTTKSSVIGRLITKVWTVTKRHVRPEASRNNNCELCICITCTLQKFATKLLQKSAT